MTETGMFKELYNYRHMVYSLVKKDLRGRYKGSFFGFLWTFLNPLLQLAVYTLIFSTILKSNIEKYYLFLFVALIPWMFFSTSLTGGASCILAQKSMVTKIYFPRLVLPIAHVTAAFVNMLYVFIIIFLAVALEGVHISLTSLLCLPVIMAVEYMLALGIAFISSSVTVYFRDMEHILGILAMIWMYMTPIIYPIDFIPEKYLIIFKLNPMTSVITAYRDILYYGKTPQMETLLQAVILGALFLAIGLFTFSKLEKHFAEEL